MSSKPTILLLPGALTTPACYDHLAPHLEKAGYPTSRATLVTTNPKGDPTQVTAEQEGSNLLNNYILPLIEEGKDIIVFAHSFGATSCSGAKHELTKSARAAKGLKGGILGIIWIATCFPTDGHSQLEVLGGVWPEFVKTDTPSKGLMVFHPVKDYLYHDCPESMQEDLAKGHLPQGTSCFETPVKEPLWTDPALEGKRVYIHTALDRIFPPEAQSMFIPMTGVDWDVKEVEGGHAAFISKSEEVADIVIQAAEKWQ